MTLSSPFKVIANDNFAPSFLAPKLRFQRIQDLKTGEVVGLATETDMTFEETALFGFATGESFQSPAQWLGDVIEKIGREIERLGLRDRPVSITAPLAALTHPDAPMAAEAGARRANICTQEIRIEFADAAIYEAEDIAPAYIQGFYSRGFRIGIDASLSWKSPFTAYLGTVIEAIRVNSHLITEELHMADRVDAAYGSGAMLYAINASWQDADRLSEIGISHAISPRLNG